MHVKFEYICCLLFVYLTGRNILGNRAAQILTEHLPHLVSSTLIYSTLDAAQLRKHVECVEDQEWLRGQLRDRGRYFFYSLRLIIYFWRI